MLSESGIDLDFDVFAELEQDRVCYELKSKSLTMSRQDPSFLMDPDIQIKPDPDSLSNGGGMESTSAASTSRANFKQLLMREQLLESERKNIQKIVIDDNTTFSSPQPLSFSNNISNAIAFNPTINTSRSLAPIRTNIQNVPSSVLKVETKLQNPTQYYIKQQQKKQILEYLSSQQNQQQTIQQQQIQTQKQQQQIRQKKPSFPKMPVSVPSQFNFNDGYSSPSFLTNSTGVTNNAMISPNSPDTTNSIVSEVDSVLDDIFGFDTAAEQDFDMFTDSVFSATLPTTNNLLDTYARNTNFKVESGEDQVSSSCPAQVKQESPECLTKERQKKDNHNLIERRRRYNINDRIKELGTLVPKIDNDFKQNKGTILKSSVDYIRRLKKERDRFRQYEGRYHSAEDSNRKLTLRVQELELILRAANIGTNLPEPDLSNQNSPQMSQLMMNSQQYHSLQLPRHLAVSAPTLQTLLTAPPGTSSETTATAFSSSIDSPRQDLRLEGFDEDTILMDAD